MYTNLYDRHDLAAKILHDANYALTLHNKAIMFSNIICDGNVLFHTFHSFIGHDINSVLCQKWIFFADTNLELNTPLHLVLYSAFTKILPHFRGERVHINKNCDAHDFIVIYFISKALLIFIHTQNFEFYLDKTQILFIGLSPLH